MTQKCPQTPDYRCVVGSPLIWGMHTSDLALGGEQILPGSVQLGSENAQNRKQSSPIPMLWESVKTPQNLVFWKRKKTNKQFLCNGKRKNPKQPTPPIWGETLAVGGASLGVPCCGSVMRSGFSVAGYPR